MTTTQKKTDGVCQLRIYEVLPDKREIFHTRFKDHALRIMKRYGFEITALWESTSVVNFEFVYLLRWPDVATMDRQWKAFLADEEWIEIKRQTVQKNGEPVIRVTSRVLDDIEYSPVGKTG